MESAASTAPMASGERSRKPCARFSSARVGPTSGWFAGGMLVLLANGCVVPKTVPKSATQIIRSIRIPTSGSAAANDRAANV